MSDMPRCLEEAQWSGVGEGWYPILEAAQLLLDAVFPDQWRAAQIKEKFGTLRFYVDLPTAEDLPRIEAYSTDELHEQRYIKLYNIAQGILSAAEWASATVCEYCGKPGELRQTGWLLTLCDDCLKERENRE